MSTNLTIKRYNGTTWEELYPKTIIEQVDGLETALSGKQATLTFDNAPTQNSTNPVKSGGIYTAINNVMNVANGKTNTYVCSYTNPNQVLNSTADTITIPKEDNDLQSVEGEDIGVGGLKLGDVIYVTETDVPDRWVGSITSTNVVLYKMETTKVDLSSYLTAVSYDSSTHKITYTKSSGSTDVVDLDNFASISSGTVSIGGATITPLTSHQTMYYREIKVGGTQKIANTATTALDFKNTHSVQHTYDGGLHSFVMTQTTPSGDNRVTGEIAFIIPEPTT